VFPARNFGLTGGIRKNSGLGSGNAQWGERWKGEQKKKHETHNGVKDAGRNGPSIENAVYEQCVIREEGIRKRPDRSRNRKDPLEKITHKQGWLKSSKRRRGEGKQAHEIGGGGPRRQFRQQQGENHR